MTERNRQLEYDYLMAQVLEDPQLKNFLEIFNISQDQYIKAIAQFEIVTVTSTNSTRSQGGNVNATMVRNNSRD